MEVLEVVARLHELGEVGERRARQRAADTTDGLTPDQRRVGVAALEDDARFLHSLAEQLERNGGPSAYSAENRETIEFVLAQVSDRG